GVLCWFLAAVSSALPPTGANMPPPSGLHYILNSVSVITKAPFVVDHTTKTVRAGGGNDHRRSAGGRQAAEHAGQRTRRRPLERRIVRHSSSLPAPTGRSTHQATQLPQRGLVQWLLSIGARGASAESVSRLWLAV